MQRIQTTGKCLVLVRSKYARSALTEPSLIVSALSARYLQAVETVATAGEYFIRMGNGIAASHLTQWELDITTAKAERLENPAAMDILGALAKPAERSQSPESSSVHSDAEEWIQMAIDHERMQCVEKPSCSSSN
jgi:hypothetical protein